MKETVPPTGSLMARLDHPRSATPTRFAVVSDPHVATRSEGTSKLFEHTESHLRAAVADINDRDVHAVLSPGDLTKDGEPWNYDAVDAALADLDAPLYAVPGNHDVPKERDDHDTIPVASFADRYADGDLPFHVTVGGVDIVGLNSAGSRDRLYDSHDGEIDDDQLDWLDGVLDGVDDPIVLTHHNLPAMSDQLRRHRDAVEPEMHMPPMTRNVDPFLGALAAVDHPLLLTGHLHLPSTARMRGVREVMSPTTCSFPQSYLVVDVDETGTTIALVPVADADDLAMAHARRTADSTTSRGLTTIAAARLAAFPLVDEHAD
ncbi:metallophosphoesterase family protein [Halocalculus aciditolerans]|uniref:Calcineurin-like phosphoesterase domain-containing protein n=1 Tax=Halocalculus aciditolerans TaxID=1383812 RepID=A0A830FM66_9EURY|nr:metallophosphoesterase [Halocalculus aciditolerans]GGL66345.1 hypothetical protein GCM10009039_25360 [Halocalculus aciditolerans]